MKNKRKGLELIKAANGIAHGEPFIIEGKRLRVQPQNNPMISPCVECAMGINCTFATSKLCEFADFVNAQSCILIEA